MPGTMMIARFLSPLCAILAFITAAHAEPNMVDDVVHPSIEETLSTVALAANLSTIFGELDDGNSTIFAPTDAA